MNDRETAPYQPHSQTSVDAAGSLDDLTARQEEVLVAFLSRGARGFTDEELIYAISRQNGRGPNSIRPRRVELFEAGHVHDSGQTRTTRAGRNAVVWVASCHRPELGMAGSKRTRRKRQRSYAEGKADGWVAGLERGAKLVADHLKLADDAWLAAEIADLLQQAREEGPQ